MASELRYLVAGLSIISPALSHLVVVLSCVILLGLFGGSARPVMAHLVEMGKISKEDIDDAQKLLREQSSRSDKDTGR